MIESDWKVSEPEEPELRYFGVKYVTRHKNIYSEPVCPPIMKFRVHIGSITEIIAFSDADGTWQEAVWNL